MIQLIPKQTAAYTAVFYFHREHIGCSVVVDGVLGAAETIPLKYVGTDGTTLTAATDSAGDPVELALDNSAEGISFACKLSVAKPITAQAVGVNIHGIL